MFERRREEILSLLNQNQSLTIKEISDTLSVSEMTIRRDLSRMEKNGEVQRSFGGVCLTKGIFIEKVLPIRANNLPEAKRKIALVAEKLVEDGMSLLLDAGTTIYELAKRISKKNLIIATSSLRVAMCACEGNAEVYVSGGRIAKTHLDLRGRIAEDFYEGMNYDYAFVGAGGISIKGGVTEYTEEAASLKRIMLGQAKTKVLLADHSKFDFKQIFKSVELSLFDIIITDMMPSKEYVDYFKKNNVKLVIADES